MSHFMEDLKKYVRKDVIKELLKHSSEDELPVRVLHTKLLSSSAKTEKDVSTYNGVLYLSPANETSKNTLCPWSTSSCRESCIIYSGRLAMERARLARIYRTIHLLVYPSFFYAQLFKEIKTLEYRAKKLGVQPVVRLNGTSDLHDDKYFKRIPQVSVLAKFPKQFPGVQFVEYTKNPNFKSEPNQSHTFSYSGANLNEAVELLKAGKNVSVVFEGDLPQVWNNYKVIDGDIHDNRHKDPQGFVVGLTLKGNKKSKTKAVQGGFAIPKQGVNYEEQNSFSNEV